jgi:phosphomevalonate kinase
MTIEASAPGKLVILGEYAVLSGASAMAMAIDRRCRAVIDTTVRGRCELTIRAGRSARKKFARGSASGAEIVDRVVEAWPDAHPRDWRGAVDSRPLYAGDAKFGLGSSAAALVAWAGAWLRFTRGATSAAGPSIEALISVHRRCQGGAGSGLDVAVSGLGGVVEYRLDGKGDPEFGSVALPNSVRFVAIFTGRPVETPALLGQFDTWRAANPVQAGKLIDVLARVADSGLHAARSQDAERFLGAVAEYGSRLDELGKRIGVDIVTTQHRKIAAHAARCRVAYKVSGAGGGDVGLAFATDAAALERFSRNVGGFAEVLDLSVEPTGLVVEGEAA